MVSDGARAMEEAMSVLGQKQTYAPQKVMSALPPIADMCGATRDVRYGPIADIPTITSVQESNAATRGKVTLISVNSPGCV